MSCVFEGAMAYLTRLYMTGKTNPKMYLGAHGLEKSRKGGLLTLHANQLVEQNYYERANSSPGGKGNSLE